MVCFGYSKLLSVALALLLGLLLFQSTAQSSPLAPTNSPTLLRAAQQAGTWSTLGHGFMSAVDALVIYQDAIYAAGWFSYACETAECDSYHIRRNMVAKWNGATWETLGFGLGGPVSSLVIWNNQLIAAGDFHGVCADENCSQENTITNNIAKWNGTTWEPLGYGLGDPVYALAVFQGDLYAGGLFRLICGEFTCTNSNTLTNYISRWSGTAWEPLAYGVDQYVYGLHATDEALYVGGALAYICSNPVCSESTVHANSIAVWDGSAWSTLGNGLTRAVYTIRTIGTDVYAGGFILQICGTPTCKNQTTANYLVKWNGQTWKPLDHGVSSLVSTLEVHGSDLYVGGPFSAVCRDKNCAPEKDLPVNHIAKWNGYTWARVASGLGEGSPSTFAFLGDTLMIGGAFQNNCLNVKCNKLGPRLNNLALYTCAATPDAPIPSAPANGVSLGTTRPVLQWQAADCADTYKIEITDAKTHSLITSKSGIRKLKFKTKALSQGKTYNWVVSACKDVQCTASKIQSFKIQ